MTKVSFFTHNLEIGGAQRIVVNITSELAERGRDVEIVLQRKSGRLLDQVHPDVPIVDLDADPFIPMVRQLRKYLKKCRPDILLSTVNTANLAASIAIQITRTGTQHIVRMAGNPSIVAKQYDKRLTDRPIPYLMKILYPMADDIITISKGQANDFVENYHVNWQDIHTISNPVITEKMLKKGEEPIECSIFDNPNTRVILGVGRLSKQKDFQALIKAFSLIHEQDSSYRLVILGEGTERSALESLRSSLDLDDHIVIPGETDNPYPYFAKADLFVLSSQWESFGNVIVEAMAFGTPVVATNCPYGPSEILAHGEYGPLVPVGDVERLSKAIKNTLEDPLKESELQRRSQDFSTEHIVDEYEKLLFR